METTITSHPTQSELLRQLNADIGGGYGLVRHGKTAAGCDQWLLAWEVVGQMTTADLITWVQVLITRHGEVSQDKCETTLWTLVRSAGA
jgi:hypothetical protein